MSSIWDNTYTLGNSSGTVISAGPGIKIDDSQPGVIKVSNDETVLWSAPTTAGAVSGITLSEPSTNFEKLKIKFRTNDNIPFEDNVFPEQYNFTLMGKFFWVNQRIGYLKMSTFSSNDARTSIDLVDGAELQFGTSYSKDNGNRLYIQKVYGVNRIS